MRCVDPIYIYIYTPKKKRSQEAKLRWKCTREFFIGARVHLETRKTGGRIKERAKAGEWLEWPRVCGLRRRRDGTTNITLVPRSSRYSSTLLSKELRETMLFWSDHESRDKKAKQNKRRRWKRCRAKGVRWMLSASLIYTFDDVRSQHKGLN